MKKYKSLASSHKNGGGNFGSSRLAYSLHAHTKGRLASFLGVMLVVLFVFTAPLALSSCSSNDEEEDSPASSDYQSLLTAHDWQITSANQRLSGFMIDMKEADTYCHFTPDSIVFSEGETVNYFEDEGKVTKSEYRISPISRQPYYINGDEIKIDNHIFKITINQSAADSSLILENEEWELVLKNEE